MNCIGSQLQNNIFLGFGTRKTRHVAIGADLTALAKFEIWLFFFISKKYLYNYKSLHEEVRSSDYLENNIKEILMSHMQIIAISYLRKPKNIKFFRCTMKLIVPSCHNSWGSYMLTKFGNKLFVPSWFSDHFLVFISPTYVWYGINNNISPNVTEIFSSWTKHFL